MRVAVWHFSLALTVLLVGCKQQPSFDERFKAKQGELEDRANAIDRELDASRSQAAADGSGGNDTPDADGSGGQMQADRKHR